MKMAIFRITERTERGQSPFLIIGQYNALSGIAVLLGATNARADTTADVTPIKSVDDLDPSTNPLELNQEHAAMTFRVFYPRSRHLPSSDQIGQDGITLANKLILDASRVQDVADVVENFGPGGIVRASLATIARRVATGQITDLFDELSFEEKLGNFGAAINPGNRVKFHELFVE